MRLVQNEKPATAGNGEGALKLSVVGNPKDNINSLRAQHRSWGLPTKAQIGWLLDHGVSTQTLERELISATTVRLDGRFFIPDLDGEKALIFRATDRDEVIDLVAWAPTSGNVGSFLGLAFCLGELEQTFCPSTWFASGGLDIHRSPLDWLRMGKRGIVILKPELTYAFLRRCSRLICTDRELAAEVSKRLAPPRQTAKIYVRKGQEQLRG